MPDRNADLVFTNGRIYTLDRKRPWASAVAVKGGRIIVVGEGADVAALMGPATRVVDLKGAMMMPGIVDVHAHLMMGGQAELFELRFPPTASFETLIARVGEAAAKAPEGSWIIGGQWGSDLLPKLNRLEALAALDRVSHGRLVMLRDDTYHNRWVNSEALGLAGLSASSPDPKKGSIGRDPATGALTGMMIESAAGIVERTIAQSGHYTEEMDRAAMARSIATLNSYGVTAFLDAAAMQPILAALKGLDDRGELTAWSVSAMPAVEPSFMFGIAGEELIALREQYRGVHAKPDFVKIFLDGVPGARTAAFHEPYTKDPVLGCCFRGSTIVTVPELIRWIGKCEKLGLGVKIHCAGDAAVSQALDAIDVARSFNGPTKLKHHIAHASYIAPDDIARFAELGVVADLSPFLWYPTSFLEGHKQTMGEARALRFWPNKDLLAAGALLAGGSDWPVMPNPDPWDGIEGLVTRRNPSGEFPGASLWPEQAIDIATALEIFTINSARAVGLADTVGSIEIGKSADLIVLDRNVLETPAKDLADTKVLTTWFEGRVVYERA
ncbi:MULTISPECIES: amidohydrolase [unclassified Mesorhizobium]|uniref:amidohydrolase n=1 Tax=unclassified Mesorhizobium TaxID=325217 RepID=UPI00112E8813|nr:MULTISPECIES: amidohydrolase [unclassified Mesorhizobium]TPL02705.1 amidohydrolase [Mesorhizobium sp. B2-4-16]TPL71702.1 amidohydrolase [Mesorhizobium sp. B2-4-3]